VGSAAAVLLEDAELGLLLEYAELVVVGALATDDELDLVEVLATVDSEAFVRVRRVVCEGGGSTLLDQVVCVVEEIGTCRVLVEEIETCWTLVEEDIDIACVVPSAPVEDVDRPRVVPSSVDTKSTEDASHVRVGLGIGQMVVVAVTTMVTAA
jgi:hypothetical protein